MAYSNGDKVELKGKTYTIVGRVARSYLVEDEAGKKYKVTENMINRIQGSPNAKPAKRRKSQSPSNDMAALERRVQYEKIFNKDAAIPQTETEIFYYFSGLACALSPENLSSDGELSRSQVTKRLAEIRSCWRALETLLGRKVTEDDVYAREEQDQKF